MRSDESFFLRAAIAMALVIAAGFSLQLAAGRSSFSAPLLVHAHAIVFMGWMVIFLLQNVFAITANAAMHRRLGWIATGWVVAMVALGGMVTTAIARRGEVVFFFQPQHFIVFGFVGLLFFAGLTIAAIAMRRRTDWHRRLHLCATSMLLSPGIGRLLPMPLLQPWAFEATFAAALIFPAIGVMSDIRRNGHAHPAWRWGIGSMIVSLLLIEAISFGPMGGAIYTMVTAGSPGAEVPALEFAPSPFS